MGSSDFFGFAADFADAAADMFGALSFFAGSSDAFEDLSA